MIRQLEKLYKNYPRLQQVSTLFAVNILLIPLSLISNIFITAYLGKVGFGDFKWMMMAFSLAMVIFNFGFYQAGNRALVLNSDLQKARELYGSMLIILGCIFIIYVTVLMFYTFFDNNISEKNLRSLMVFVIPFSWMFLITNYFEVLFQADNRISLLAKSRLYPKILFFIAILILYLAFRDAERNRLLVVWIIFLGTHIAGYLYILYKLNPSFRNARERIAEIWHYNKVYGFNVYIGTLFNVALSNLTGLLIGYSGETNTGVGYYSLATTISEPLNVIPNVIATTHYKEFSLKKRIERRLTLITIAASLLVLVLCWILVGPFIRIFYQPEFKPVIFLTYIVSTGIIFHGLGDFFNRFLGAHGQGKALRNSAIVVGIVLLVCNFTLVPAFEETGAAITRIFAGLVYLLSMLWFYRRLVLRLSDHEGSV